MTYHFEQNPIGQRLKAQMQQCGISSSELAKRADVKTSFIYDVISGKSANPSPVKLARMADSLGVDLGTLVGSPGHFHAPGSPIDHVAIARITVQFSTRSDKIVLEEKTAEPHYFKTAWIRDRIGSRPCDLKMLYVHGDGMEPTICAGDLLMIDSSQKVPSPPGIFILFDGLGLVTKRLEYTPHNTPPKLRITSDNPQYPAYERSLDETYIIGRVVWFSREL